MIDPKKLLMWNELFLEGSLPTPPKPKEEEAEELPQVDEELIEEFSQDKIPDIHFFYQAAQTIEDRLLPQEASRGLWGKTVRAAHPLVIESIAEALGKELGSDDWFKGLQICMTPTKKGPEPVSEDGEVKKKEREEPEHIYRGNTIDDAMTAAGDFFQRFSSHYEMKIERSDQVAEVIDGLKDLANAKSFDPAFEKEVEGLENLADVLHAVNRAKTGTVRVSNLYDYFMHTIGKPPETVDIERPEVLGDDMTLFKDTNVEALTEKLELAGLQAATQGFISEYKAGLKDLDAEEEREGVLPLSREDMRIIDSILDKDPEERVTALEKAITSYGSRVADDAEAEAIARWKTEDLSEFDSEALSLNKRLTKARDILGYLHERQSTVDDKLDIGKPRLSLSRDDVLRYSQPIEVLRFYSTPQKVTLEERANMIEDVLTLISGTDDPEKSAGDIANYLLDKRKGLNTQFREKQAKGETRRPCEDESRAYERLKENISGKPLTGEDDIEADDDAIKLNLNSNATAGIERQIQIYADFNALFWSDLANKVFSQADEKTSLIAETEAYEIVRQSEDLKDAKAKVERFLSTIVEGYTPFIGCAHFDLGLAEDRPSNVRNVDYWKSGAAERFALVDIHAAIESDECSADLEARLYERALETGHLSTIAKVAEATGHLVGCDELYQVLRKRIADGKAQLGDDSRIETQLYRDLFGDDDDEQIQASKAWLWQYVNAELADIIEDTEDFREARALMKPIKEEAIAGFSPHAEEYESQMFIQASGNLVDAEKAYKKVFEMVLRKGIIPDQAGERSDLYVEEEEATEFSHEGKKYKTKDFTYTALGTGLTALFRKTFTDAGIEAVKRHKNFYVGGNIDLEMKVLEDGDVDIEVSNPDFVSIEQKDYLFAFNLANSGKTDVEVEQDIKLKCYHIALTQIVAPNLSEDQHERYFKGPMLTEEGARCIKPIVNEYASAIHQTYNLTEADLGGKIESGNVHFKFIVDRYGNAAIASKHAEIKLREAQPSAGEALPEPEKGVLALVPGGKTNK